jgi:CheY-like chemotaxis protein
MEHSQSLALESLRREGERGDGELAPFRVDDGTPRRCLVVDDYEINRRTLARLFTSVLRPETCWTIEEAANGEAALQMAANTHYDIVTLDFNMRSSGGTLTGAETAARLKASALEPTVMIGITGGSSAGDVEKKQLLAGGCRYVWGKPPPHLGEVAELLFGQGQRTRSSSRLVALFDKDDVTTPRVALVCDDDAHIRRALERMLRRMLPSNWAVVTVVNGEEALNTDVADFYLMDFHMAKSGGKLNGAETTALLLQRHPETKIVGITANAAPGAEEPKKLMAAGCLEVFGKPIQANVLEECIFSCDGMLPLQDVVTRSLKSDKRKKAKSHAATSHVFDEPRAVQLHGESSAC